MKIDDFFNMCIQVVADMGYLKGLQINTIFITDRLPNLREDSLGALYTDFTENRFWSRTWVRGGAKRSKGPFAEWPILIIQPLDVEMECLDSYDTIYKFDILIVDQVGCDNCPNTHERTPTHVKRNLLKMIRLFFAELYTYELVELDRTPDANTFEWLSKGRLDFTTTGPGAPTYVRTIEAITASIQPPNIIFKEWGNTDDLRAYYTTITISECDPVESNFVYNKPVVKQLATTICDSC